MITPNNLSSLLHSALNTIMAFSEELNSYEPSDEILCHYCAHFPMGGDGNCGYKNPTRAECNFEWRYAKQLNDVIKEIEQ